MVTKKLGRTLLSHQPCHLHVTNFLNLIYLDLLDQILGHHNYTNMDSSDVTKKKRTRRKPRNDTTRPCMYHINGCQWIGPDGMPRTAHQSRCSYQEQYLSGQISAFIYQKRALPRRHGVGRTMTHSFPRSPFNCEPKTSSCPGCCHHTRVCQNTEVGSSRRSAGMQLYYAVEHIISFSKHPGTHRRS